MSVARYAEVGTMSADRRPTLRQSLPVPRNALLVIAASAYAVLCGRLLLEDVHLATLAAALPAIGAGVFTASAVAERLQMGAVWVILLLAAAPWQFATAANETGAVDTASGVTLVKLLLTAAAFGFAFLRRRPGVPYPVALKILLLYALFASLVGLIGADPSSSLSRGVRLCAVILAVGWVTTRFPRRTIALLLVGSTLVISVLALATHWAGVGSAGGGRLSGYLPPLHPNVLGLMAAAGFLCATALVVRRELGGRAFCVSASVLALTIFLTQSRTSFIALLVALLALSAPGLRSRGPVIVYALVFAFMAAIMAQTFTATAPLKTILTHGGSSDFTATLAPRQSSWRSVWDINAQNGREMIGNGLAAKSAEVHVGYARYASIDGTWPATYLSTGLGGVLLLIAAFGVVLVSAMRRRDGFALALCVFLLTSSATVAVCNDVEPGLILLLSLAIPRGDRAGTGERTDGLTR